METKPYVQPVSNLAIHPGELLAEEIECIGMTQQELATRIDRSPQFVSAIIEGAKNIQPDIAAKLEEVLGIPSSMWIDAQKTYDDTLARQQVEQKAAHLS
ncbi:MAG: HigA family addiction module antitoxin [Chloroflexi bacterium]|nr:HigA family addiction module antitoxin [Chloroflexota bacterium]